ncbi:hypothetical protein ABIB40_003318 [Pedobacter sp. UYP30]|uniref:hypothetical protein n=1 Tax=Pedobacter sp. UYP30 TaxID=1756400 RepID=UPI0033943E13
MRRSKSVLAFEQLEAEMSLLISSELEAITGGGGSAQDTVDYMLAENISSYSSSNGYSSSGGDFGFGTGSTPIDLGTVDVYGKRTGSSEVDAAAAVGLAADSHILGGAGATALNFAASGEAIEGAAFKAFTGSGTVIGMVAGGLPAGYNIYQSFENGGHGSSADWIALGLAGLAGAAEFTGLGEAYDGTVGVGIAAGTLGYDAYEAYEAAHRN